MTTKWPLQRILKLGLYATIFGGTVASLKANQYKLNEIGIIRFGRAVVTVTDIAANYQKNLYSADARKLDQSSEEFLTLRSKIHRTSAEKLLELCKANKGVYIKVGQHIGALEYLVPKEYVETMQVLHYQAPHSTSEEIFGVLREDLKREPCELFSSIETEPQGAASLAQVHKATLKDGSVVALKIQHPRVMPNAFVDMKTMEGLVTIVQWIFPDFRIKWLVDEMRKNIPLELDFLNEAKNCERVTKMFECFPWLKVPKVYKEYSTKRVLIMEFVDGGHVNDLQYMRKHKINTAEVSDKLGHLYSRMIFNEGFVHSDPHPGNILVSKSSSGHANIILLDHGLYATLTDEVRWAYSKLWLSILNRDFEGIKEQCDKLGVGDMYDLFACMISGRTWDSIQSGLSTTKYTAKEKETLQQEIPHAISEILNILASVNCQLLLILKTNDLIRGIEHTLQAHSRNISFLVMSKCCVNSVYCEKLQNCEGRLKRVYVIAEQKWMLLKLSMYYMYLNIMSIFS